MFTQIHYSRLETDCVEEIDNHGNSITLRKYTKYIDGVLDEIFFDIDDTLPYIHRLNGPAITTFHHDGGIKSERWINNDLDHKINGPATIEYNKNGEIIKEKWFMWGSLHNSSGPAIINYETKEVEFHIGGVNITNIVNEWIKNMNIQSTFNWGKDEFLLFKLVFGNNTVYT